MKNNIRHIIFQFQKIKIYKIILIKRISLKRKSRVKKKYILMIQSPDSKTEWTLMNS